MKYKKSNFSKFLLLWAGEFISAIGGGLTSFGLGVYVFQQTGSAASNLWFSEESVLTWPASGAVINGYSMDETVFFQTLEQYQYNPAMIISGEAG